MIDMKGFKEQLLDFVEDREEPFDVKFLVMNCNHLISDYQVYDALYELEEEGLIVRFDHGLNEGYYLSTRTIMRRWLKPKESKGSLPDNLLSPNMIQQIRRLLGERPELGYTDINEFVRDAVRRFIQQIRKS